MRLQQNIFRWIIWLLWLDLLAAALAGFTGCCFGWIYWLALSLDLLAASVLAGIIGCFRWTVTDGVRCSEQAEVIGRVSR